MNNIRAALDMSLSDGMAVDCEGSIWKARGQVWVYLDGNEWAMWDARSQLPKEYEPYIILNNSAQTAIRESR